MVAVNLTLHSKACRLFSFHAAFVSGSGTLLMTPIDFTSFKIVIKYQQILVLKAFVICQVKVLTVFVFHTCLC